MLTSRESEIEKQWRIEGRYWVRKSDGLRIPIIQGGGKALVSQRASWAFGDDDGTESGHTLDTENVDRDSGGSGTQAADTPFLIRMCVAETAGGTSNVGFALFSNKNSSGTWNEVTTSSTDGLRIANDTNSRSDDEATTDRLSYSAQPFTAGKYDDGQTQQGTTGITLSTQNTELEFCIEIDSANASTGDIWELRVEEADGTDLASYPAALPFVEAATIAPSYSLTVADVSHTHSEEAVSLTKHDALSGVADISHTHSLEAPTLTLPGAYNDFIDIDLEENDFTDFDATSGNVTVTAGSALAGTSYGMAVDATDGTTSYGEISSGISTSLSGVTGYRMRFYFDPNGFSMPTASNFWLVWARTSGGAMRLEVKIQENAGTYEIRLGTKDDAESTSATAFYTISDAEHYIEARFLKASSAVASDGSIQLFVDGTSKETVSGIDNYDTFDSVDQCRWGTATAGDTGASGTFFLDQIIWRDADTEIGPHSEGGATLTVADVSHTHAVEAANVTYNASLTVADIAHTNALEVANVTYNASLTVADLAHTNALEAAVLTFHPLYSLVVQDVAHTNALESFSLAYNASLLINEITHSHALDAFIVVFNALLVTQDISHTHAAENAVLTYNPPGALEVHDIAHTHAVENVQVIYDGQAAAAAITHAHSLESVTLSYNANLVISEPTHTHSVETIGLVYHGVLQVADISHTNALEAANVSYGGVLTIAEPWHQHTLESPTLEFFTSQSAQPDDIAHAHVLEAINLAYTANIQVTDLSHVHALEAPELVYNGAQFNLTVADVTHLNVLESPQISFNATLAISDVTHAHVMDGLRFGGVTVSYMHDHDDFMILMT